MHFVQLSLLVVSGNNEIMHALLALDGVHPEIVDSRGVEVCVQFLAPSMLILRRQSSLHDGIDILVVEVYERLGDCALVPTHVTVPGKKDTDCCLAVRWKTNLLVGQLASDVQMRP